MGRPEQAYDAQGGKVWEAVYDIYGGLRNIEGGKGFIPFRQAGQYEDNETGLYYNRFRYYSPQTGSYLSKDPIGLAGGFCLYSYVKDSNFYVDPFGWKDIWYRALNPDDMIMLDLGGNIEAKNPLAKQPVSNHVNFGSENWYSDQYIIFLLLKIKH